MTHIQCSKLIDYNLVSHKKPSTGLESFWVMIKEPVDDQIYFSISESNKNWSEQLMNIHETCPILARLAQYHQLIPLFKTPQLNLSARV